MKEFLKKEPVLVLAVFLAGLSATLVKPSYEYFNYIDFSVLSLLFCLMVVVSGLQSIGVFDYLSSYMMKYMKNIRQFFLIMVSLCFFSSMIITNDVALITFIPFTIMILTSLEQKDKLISIIVLETIAANLGSMLTPIGNPQNLYIYTVSHMSLLSFVRVMLPITIISYLFLFIIVCFVTKQNETIAMHFLIKEVKDKRRLLVYTFLFALCIGTVLHLIPYVVLTGVIIVVAITSDKGLIKKVDYSLLVTFIAFFIFIGNMQHMEFVKTLIQERMADNTILFAIISSQFISNVPAAVLLSGFTKNYVDLLIGINIGGLGTLIASMASLISYRYYVGVHNHDAKKYISVFTMANVVFLVLLLTTVPIIK